MSPFVKSTVWTYFKADAPDAVFMGHKPATMKIISLQVYVIEGGLDEDGKRKLISDAIKILGRYSNQTQEAAFPSMSPSTMRRRSTGVSAVRRPI